jgi:LPXTG-motif cell wall-anchored protein
MIVALCAISIVIAASVTPRLVAGNPTCSDVGYYDLEHKIDPPTPGSYPIGSGMFSWTTSDGVYFDWTSNIAIDAVICKGGPLGAYVYDYNPASKGDNGLYCPNTPTGNPAGISHITVCFDDSNEVPEFTAIGASLALLGAGIFIWKKRK